MCTRMSSRLRRHLLLALCLLATTLVSATSGLGQAWAAQPSAGATLTATPATTGHLAGVIACSFLAQKDFSTIPNASTTITSTTTVVATATSPEACKIDGVIAPQAKFELQLPTKQWNGDYFEGGVAATAECSPSQRIA